MAAPNGKAPLEGELDQLSAVRDSSCGICTKKPNKMPRGGQQKTVQQAQHHKGVASDDKEQRDAGCRTSKEL